MSRAAVDPIVAQLRRRRQEMGLSQAAVARRLFTGPTMVNERELGKHSPQLAQLRRWAAVLGYDLALVPLEVGDG